MKNYLEKIRHSFSRDNFWKAFLANLFIVLVLVLGLGILFLTFQNYTAEVYHSRGLSFLVRKDYDNSIRSLEKAVKLNPKMDVYWRDLSQAYLAKVFDLIKNKKDLSSKEGRNRILSLIGKSLDASKEATQVNMENVANWNVRGYIYQNMIGILGGADDWAIKSYKEALKLESNNPFIYTQLGRVYLAKADLLKNTKDEAKRKEALDSALKYFRKAIALKPDYAPAHYQIATLYIREGNLQEAIKKLEDAQRAAPMDVGLAFQLGIVYYSNNQLDKAQQEFERAVTLSPKFSNARYYLGLIYDKKGEKEKAIEQFKEIEKYNPDNKLVKSILHNLETGKPALEGIKSPAGVPIEEKPKEIEK